MTKFDTYDSDKLRAWSLQELEEFARYRCEKSFVDIAIICEEGEMSVVTTQMCINYRKKLGQVILGCEIITKYGDRKTWSEYELFYGNGRV